MNKKASSFYDYIIRTEEALAVSVKISWREELKLVVNDLIRKRNSEGNKIKSSFDDVLMYYLGEDDFKKYVIEGKEIE